VQHKSVEFIEFKDIEEKLEKIENNERRLEVLCSRVDNLENFSLRYNQNNNEQPSGDGNIQEHQVNAFYYDIFYIQIKIKFFLFRVKLKEENG
jgi:hypothetical protein